jgi:hypothetical protein
MGQRLPPSPRLPWLANLRRGIWKRYATFGECAGTPPEQPRGDQHCQYDGGKLGYIAGIGALQYRIDQAAVVVAGIEDLMQDPDCQHTVQGGAHHDTHEQPNHNAQDQQSSDADQYGERRHLIIEEQQRDVHARERQCHQNGGHDEVEAGLQAGLQETSLILS